MEKYFRNLVEEFVRANGIKSSDINSNEFIKDFYEWIKQRNLIGLQYTYFLEYLGFDFKTNNCAEVGKTNYDSVVLPYNTLIISPVASSFDSIYDSRVIAGNMKVSNYEPTLVKSKNSNYEIPRSAINTYMTQNPFFISDLNGWDYLHNMRKNDIIVGIYGNIYDKDIDKKIKQIDLFKNQLDDEYESEYALLGENYFYAVGTKRLTKNYSKYHK